MARTSPPTSEERRARAPRKITPGQEDYTGMVVPYLGQAHEQRRDGLPIVGDQHSSLLDGQGEHAIVGRHSVDTTSPRREGDGIDAVTAELLGKGVRQMCVKQKPHSPP